jgi:pimeloyl-ACP methyl ester carboxylesterase
MPPSDPVIVIPGITAAYLRDEYSLPPEVVWSVLSKAYERAALHPDDLAEKAGQPLRSYEADEPARVVPDQLFEIAYKELIEELRHNLRAKEDDPVPVYPFSYDWRQPLEQAARTLDAFVEETIERTVLMKNYFRADYPARRKVNLVAHSMGGLVVATYLALYGDKKRIGKVVTIASPFRGSFEVVVKVTTGTAELGSSAPSSRERESARVTPALYYLVPSFAEGLIIDPGLPKSLFDVGLWQTSIIETIAEFIRLHGRETMNVGDRRALARKTLAAMLSAAGSNRKAIESLDLKKAGLKTTDWLAVIGVDADTRVDLKVTNTSSGPAFEFHQKDRTNKWSEPDALTRRRTGDGTVPFEGAIPPFLPYESLVCVTPGDFGFWEIADKAAVQVGGFHGILPNMNMLQLLITRFFTDRPDNHGATWGRPPPGVDKAAWRPPLQLDPKG